MDLKDKTKVIFHNGLRTIGGTLIEIVYKDNRILFDFGSVYKPNISDSNNLNILIEEDCAAYVENIYDSRLELDKASKNENLFNTAVFLSHAHLDHTKLINFLDPDIPLFASHQTKILIENLNQDNDYLYPFDSKQNSTKPTRQIIGLDFGEEISIGEIIVKILPVDHDAYGASGLIITTPTAKIAYTGDIRLHGYKRQDSLNFCKEAEESDILIIEGVSVSFNEVGSPEEENVMTTEHELLEKFLKIIQNNPEKNLSFNCYIVNLERIQQIIEKCSKYREVVLEAKHASIVKNILGLEVKYYRLGKIYANLDPNYEIPLETLLQDKNSFFWQLTQDALIYIDQLNPKSLYIHSNVAPFGPFDQNYNSFFEKFKEANIETVELGCSGHGYTTDIIKIISSIRPKIHVPIHTFRPERLFNIHGTRVIPEKGQVIVL